MEAQFISDLHLTPERPAIARAFLRFMDEQAPKAKALYILGDFFEYWVGDDAMEPFHHNIAKILKQYTDNGHTLYMMAGNRDFAIGRAFLKMTGAQWLQDPCTIKLNDENVLLMHGDLLCTDDVQYLKYRKRIRNPLVLALLRRTPLGYRKKLAARIRTSSQKSKAEKSMDIMDVNQNEVVRVMERHQVNILIHGHTHRPAEHAVMLESGTGQRVVLGDWEQQGWFLTSEPALTLHHFDID